MNYKCKVQISFEGVPLRTKTTIKTKVFFALGKSHGQTTVWNALGRRRSDTAPMSRLTTARPGWKRGLYRKLFQSTLKSIIFYCNSKIYRKNSKNILSLNCQANHKEKDPKKVPDGAGCCSGISG